MARYGSDGQRYPPPMTPGYWQQASADLAQDDLVLAGLVERFAGSALVSRGAPFVTLLRSIVGQQISVKAADSVWTRLTAALPEPTPAGVLSHDPQTLRACGLSVRKAEYVLDLARHFANGQMHVADWSVMSDAEIIAELTSVRAVSYTHLDVYKRQLLDIVVKLC